MQDAPEAVWSIPYDSVAFFSSLKHNFIAYHSSNGSSCPDCIFEIQQLLQSGFSRVYSNFCCSCSFEPEIIEIGQSSHKMYSNNIVNFQESTTILDAWTKKSGNLLKAPRTYKSMIKNLLIILVKITPRVSTNEWKIQNMKFQMESISGKNILGHHQCKNLEFGIQNFESQIT